MANIRKHTLRRLAAQEGLPDFGKGKAESFGKDLRRRIPKGHDFDHKSLKPLTKMLWATSIALGHALTAHRQFSRLKSVSFSPDGMVGGQGYVMSVKDIRSKLFEACEHLSTICDTIHDEINAPHWKPEIKNLDPKDLEEIRNLLGDAEEYIEDPEGEVKEDLEEAEDTDKEPSDWGSFKESDAASKMPDGGNIPDEAKPLSTRTTKQAYAYNRTANSSVPVETLSGPRVDHLDRGDATGPSGSYNEGEPATSDEWGQTDSRGDNSYLYPSEWDNDFRRYAGITESEVVRFASMVEAGVPTTRILASQGAQRYKLTEADLSSFLEMKRMGTVGSSALPDSATDDTPTEGFDFGVGYGGGDQAQGQGAGGYANPDSTGKGVYGPHAELPNDPGGKLRDTENSGTTEQIEIDSTGMLGNRTAYGLLPNDGTDPVARSDYFAGPKGNDFDGVVRMGDSDLPGDDSDSSYSYDRNLPNMSDTHERPDTPYVKWDYTTHNMRSDEFSQPKGPIEGPYSEKQ